MPRPTSDFEKTLPTEIVYADDVDFIGLEFADIDEVQKSLKKYNLLVNADKTEQTTLSRSGKEYKNAKKVNTLIDGDKVKRKTKIKLYRTLVKSVLTYNCGTWALTKTEEEKLNAFHRQQLRKILNIKYTVKITNSSLYEKCNECPLSITLLENRWRLFGHILRRNSEIPANKSMNSYFISHGSKFRGRPLKTLPVVLNKDLTRVSDDKLQLNRLKDLEHLRSVAQNRQTWRKLTTRIREAVKPSPSDD